MTDNKNMLKTNNNRVAGKAVSKKRFYSVVEYSVKVKDAKGKETSVTKSAVVALDEPMTRLQARKELEASAKAMGAKITYFGAFRNQ